MSININAVLSLNQMDENKIKNQFFQMASDINVGYIVLFHEYVRNKLEEKEDELSKLLVTFSGDRREKANLIEEHKAFAKNFPKQLSSNSFLLLYSHLEEFVYHIWKMYFPKIEIDSRKKGSISRYKTIFKRLFNNELPFEDNWVFITDVEKIRNCILHANGRIDLYNNTAEIKDIIKKYSNFISIENKRLIIDHEFVKFFLKRIQKIINQTEKL